MADPGDTAALCNDTKTPHIGSFEQQPGQPTEPDIEAGSVIGEEPITTEGVVGEGEEAAAEPEAADGDQSKADSKIPFIYAIVDPGCTPLSCYSAIFTFIIMTCGVLWLLLISPPLNAKAHVTRITWLKNNTTLSNITVENALASAGVIAGDTAAMLIDEILPELSSSKGSSSSSSFSSTVLPLDHDGRPPNQT